MANGLTKECTLGFLIPLHLQASSWAPRTVGWTATVGFVTPEAPAVIVLIASSPLPLKSMLLEGT